VIYVILFLCVFYVFNFCIVSSVYITVLYVSGCHLA